MTNVVFKSILIVDTEKGRARHVEFQPGLNVVTSNENHVGKSSLVKSLYYCLGAEIFYDPEWAKVRKLYALDFVVNEQACTIVRKNKSFLVFCGSELIGVCKSVMKELAPKLEEIFGFSVYLPDKDTKKHILAPPAFTYLPYYIDQDTGWKKEPYESFESVDWFKKPDRIKSLYYHLGVYNKRSVELQAKIDANDAEVERLKAAVDRAEITLETLTPEARGLVPAQDVKELEQRLEPTKRKIDRLVGDMIQVRTRIQEVESAIIQHNKHLSLLGQSTNQQQTISKDFPVACPNCGFQFVDEIPAIVREQYNLENADYLRQQISLIIESLGNSLAGEQAKYIQLMGDLSREEQVASQIQDNYETYVKQRGLIATINGMYQRIGEATASQVDYQAETNRLKKELRKLPHKKEVDERYIQDTTSNIIRLGAWNADYEGKIGLLKPLKAQGTLSSKIILAQYVSLFSTMQAVGASSIRFPFVVDSPRTMEPSTASSVEIINLISTIKTLPQIILATMDYQTFDVENKDTANIIELTEPRKLLNPSDFQRFASTIQRYEELLANI